MGTFLFSNIFDENFLLLIDFRQIISCFYYKNNSFLCIISIVSINQFLYSQQIFSFLKKNLFRKFVFSKHFYHYGHLFFLNLFIGTHLDFLSLYSIIQSNKNQKSIFFISSHPKFSLFLVIYHCTIRNWIYGHHVCYGYFCYELKKQSGEDHYLEQRKSFQKTFKAIPRLKKLEINVLRMLKMKSLCFV